MSDSIADDEKQDPAVLAVDSAESPDTQECPGVLKTMKAQLQALQRQDPACVFITRHINKLGFQSPEHLKDYFQRYGEVKSVHVSHSLNKSTRFGDENETHRRKRPAALGFVVMSAPDATAKILEEGPEHMVNGVKVTVHPFHRHSDTEAPGEKAASKNIQEKASGQRCTSPLCPICTSTVAVQLGIHICQVCKRGLIDDVETLNVKRARTHT